MKLGEFEGALHWHVLCLFTKSLYKMRETIHVVWY